VQPTDVEGWRLLFRARQAWAEDVQIKATSLATEIAKSRDALAIIQRGTEVALGNLQSHVRTLDQKYKEASTWAGNLLSEQDKAIKGADAIISCLEVLPAKTALLRYLPRLSRDDQVIHDDESTLANLAKPEDCERNKDMLQQSQKSLRSQLEALGDPVEDVLQDTEAILQSVNATRVASNKNNVAYTEHVEEIQVFVDKIVSDCVHIEELISEGRLAGQAVRIASLQTKNYLPTMVEYYDEIVHGLEVIAAQRESVVQEAVQNMQRIAKTEASFASVYAEVSDFDLPRDAADAFEAVSIASELPLAYGVLLIECVRRKEWSDKLSSESEILAEDIGGYKEEEERRRKKWLKSNAHLVASVPIGGLPTLELKLHHGDDELPDATRADLLAYKEALESLPVLEAVLERVSEVMRELDKPTNKHPKKLKGFKSGSVYDADSGRSSFLSRDSHETTALKELNQKLEEEVKAQKSRVRKLEHLVFNQTQTIRSSSANLFQAPVLPRAESPVASPDPALSPVPSPKSNVDILSRKASVNSRRASSNKPQDEKVLARRIVTLEADIYEATQKNQVLEKEKRQLQHDTEQARLTRQDLLANMNAQQQEFADERRMLKEEVMDWKRKLENVEDELERIVVSRENDKTQADEKLGIARKQIAEFEATARRRHEEERDCKAAMATIQRNLQDSEDADLVLSSHQTLTELVHNLTRLSDQASLHKLRLQEAVDVAKSENECLQYTIDRTSIERGEMAMQQKSLKRSHDQLAAVLSVREARLATIEAELEDGRSQLRILRAKFAEGETGSAVLQQRLEDQAAKAIQTATDLAEAEAEIERLNNELAILNSTQSDRGKELSTIMERLANRSIKDMELSNRLANYVRELSRLLEALGLSVLERDDGTMTIQRTSKLASTSQTLSDLSSPVSAASPLGRLFDLTIPQNLLQWPQARTLADENQAFGAFLSRLDALDLPALSDSILKLRRDVEWTGKKWKAEARSYRDKLHAATSDSTHKIAFRAFKEGDLALFLPTRNQAMRPWAAFNVGAPHYFLRETDSHQLQSREWLVARISKVQERVVDLSGKTSGSAAADTRSLRSATSSSAISFEDDNPFDLSDGLRWYLVDAVEEKTGNASLSVSSSVAGSANVPPRHLRTGSSVRGKGTPTIGTACVDATGTSVKIGSGKGKLGDASTKLGQSLDSRRSSTTSRAGSVRATKDGASDISVRVDIPKPKKKSSMANVSALARGLLSGGGGDAAKKDGDEVGGEDGSGRNEEVRKDQLWGP